MHDDPLATKTNEWDHSSDQNFVDYYAQESLSKETIMRFTRLRDNLLRLQASRVPECKILHVADIGCGTGTQARLWAELGHNVFGLDVNAPLVEIAKARANEDAMEIQFDVGSATQLPYPDSSIDIALMPELLEHVADWRGCIDEAIRVLKPGGILYLSTSNWLCPIQNEFNLPLYSWYPSFLKRHYEHLAITTRPEIANHCKYPAVNWFSYYSLSSYLNKRGFRCHDRFDMIDQNHLSSIRKFIVTAVRKLNFLRFIGQILTQGSIVYAIKNKIITKN